MNSRSRWETFCWVEGSGRVGLLDAMVSCMLGCVEGRTGNDDSDGNNELDRVTSIADRSLG